MKSILAPVIFLFAVLLSACISESPEVLTPLAGFSDNEIIRVHGPALKLTTVMKSSDVPFLGKMKSVEVFTCEKPGQTAAIQAATQSIAESRGMELLIEQRDSTETVQIYGLESQKKAGVMNEILIHAIEPTECNVVFVKGEIDISSLLKDSKDYHKFLNF